MAIVAWDELSEWRVLAVLAELNRRKASLELPRSGVREVSSSSGSERTDAVRWGRRVDLAEGMRCGQHLE
jgi:hypothetical protein